jgi:hypothetical protein
MWVFEVFLAPLLRLTAALPETIPVDKIFGGIVGLLVLTWLGYFAWGFVRQRRGMAGWAPVMFGGIWYVVMPLSIIFAQPFAAYLFMAPAFGIHLAAGHLTDQFSTRVEALVRGGRVALYAALTVFILLSAGRQSQFYARDPQWLGQKGRLSAEVIKWMAEADLNYQHVKQVYFVGFPTELFAAEGEAERSADALELYLGFHPTVTQIATVDELLPVECAGTLILAYDASTVVQRMQPPGCEVS